MLFLFPAFLPRLAFFDLTHLDILFICIFVQTPTIWMLTMIQSGHGKGHEAYI